MIDYNIISTGSKGNAVIINTNILIDVGVPFKALQPHYKTLKLVLLTHFHSDHFNKATVHKLAQERPTLRWGCCDWMVGSLLECGVSNTRIDVYNLNYQSVYGVITIVPIPMVHNVPNCGYQIHLIGQQHEKLFYATDTNTLSHITAKNYDLYMIESNYSESEISERIKEKQKQGLYCHEWDVLKNHLSKEKADNWLYQNMGSNSQYVYMHQHETKGRE